MTKEVYVKALGKYYAEHKLDKTDSYGEGYVDGLCEALDYAIELIEKLDESKKVKIPQFVADWIEEYEQYGFHGKLSTVYWLVEYISDDDEHFDWLDDKDNQELLLHAIADGYEAEG